MPVHMLNASCFFGYGAVISAGVFMMSNMLTVIAYTADLAYLITIEEDIASSTTMAEVHFRVRFENICHDFMMLRAVV